MTKRNLALWVLLLWSSLALHSQPCTYKAAMPPGSASAAQVDKQFALLEPDLKAGRWRDIGNAIVIDFDRNARVQEPLRATFRRALVLLRGELAKADGIREAKDFVPFLDRQGSNFVDVNRFNPDDDPLGKWTAFFQQDKGLKPLVVDCSVPVEERMDLYHRVELVRQVLTRFKRGPELLAQASIAATVDRWDNFIRSGYAQYPWELWLNGHGKVDLTNLEPPRRQWVFLHPSAGVEVVGGGSHSRRADVAMIEPLGHVWYSENRSFYTGASLALTLPSDRPPGAGILLHIGRYGKVGYVFRRKDGTGRNQNGVLFSLDLYGWLGDHSAAFKELRNRVAKSAP